MDPEGCRAFVEYHDRRRQERAVGKAAARLAAQATRLGTEVDHIRDVWDFSSEAAWRWELEQRAGDQRPKAAEVSGELAVRASEQASSPQA